MLDQRVTNQIDVPATQKIISANLSQSDTFYIGPKALFDFRVGAACIPSKGRTILYPWGGAKK